MVPQEYLDTLDLAGRESTWRAELAATSWPRRGVLVAEVDGEVAGFVGVCPTRDDDGDPATVGEVAAIYVAPDEWGTGLGAGLLMPAVDSLVQAGYEQATLWVMDTNARARRFYERNGWHPDGPIKQDTSRGFPLTELRYRRPL